MGSLGLATPPNLNLYCRSGSVTMPNLGPDLGPVRLGSGPDRGSESDCGNPIYVRNPGYSLAGVTMLL